jgi:hypothetical protein
MSDPPEGSSTGLDATAHSRFSSFFRGYGLSLGVILAAIPFLATSLDLLPAFQSFGIILTFATSLISLLTIAFLFGIRRHIGEAVFPPQQTRVLPSTYVNRRRRWSVLIPLVLATVSIVSLALYLEVVRSAVAEVAVDRTFVGTGTTSLRDTLRTEKRAAGWLFGDSLRRGLWVSAVAESSGTEGRIARITYMTREAEDSILSHTSVSVVPRFLLLVLAYVLVFWGAAAAFVWLGLVEYMQRELSLSDASLIRAPYRQMDKRTFLIPGVEPDTSSPLVDGLRLPIVFQAEFDPHQSHAQASVFGPLCGGLHGNRPLVYQGWDVVKALHRWACLKPGDTSGTVVHLVFLSDGEVQLNQRARGVVGQELQVPESGGSLPVRGK